MSGSVPDQGTETISGKSDRDVWNPIEKLDRAELTVKQDQLLPERIRKAYDEGGLYREVYDAAGVGPDNWTGREDLVKFPLVNKDMVREFRARTGDPFGGLSAGLVAGASVAHGSGTSGGIPTLAVSTVADRETVADELASMYWMGGAREGTKILGMQNFGVRVELPAPMAAFKIGAIHVLPDMSASSLYQIEYLRPQISWSYPGWLDGIAAAASAAGKELDAILEPFEILWYGGRYLSPPRRARLEQRVGASIYEVGGMGDIGLHISSCSAQDGMHVREDLFVVETIDPETSDPLPPGAPGELVFTSLWDEGMHHVRWRSDDMGLVKAEPCTCGRTCARIFQLGRVWERTVIDGTLVMPAQVDDVLYEIGEREIPFQIVRSKNGTHRPYVRVVVPDGVGIDELSATVCAGLEVEVEVRATTTEELLGPEGAKQTFKYAQVKDQ